MHRRTHIAQSIRRTTLFNFSVWLFVAMLGCKVHTEPDNHSVQLNLQKLGPFPGSVKFDPIRTYAELPQKIRERIGPNVSNPKGPFNAGDISIPGIPDRRMLFAYGSAQYYLVCYEKGGITHEFVVALFEVSADQIVARWAHAGKKFNGIEEFRKRIDQSPLENEVNEIVW